MTKMMKPSDESRGSVGLAGTLALVMAIAGCQSKKPTETPEEAGLVDQRQRIDTVTKVFIEDQGAELEQPNYLEEIKAKLKRVEELDKYFDQLTVEADIYVDPYAEGMTRNANWTQEKADALNIKHDAVLGELNGLYDEINKLLVLWAGILDEEGSVTHSVESISTMEAKELFHHLTTCRIWQPECKEIEAEKAGEIMNALVSKLLDHLDELSEEEVSSLLFELRRHDSDLEADFHAYPSEEMRKMRLSPENIKKLEAASSKN